MILRAIMFLLKSGSLPYAERLGVIELRGDSLKDGFWVKEEYKDCFISNSGEIFRYNVFE